jgi:hypothetical protein
MSTLLLLVLGILGPDGAGTSAFPLLRIGQGPRAAAMGEAFVSIADDASAIYWNPAGLGTQGLTRFAFSHQEWFMSIRDEVLQATIPSGPGALGFGLVYTGDGGIQAWDENNMPGDTFMTWSGIASAGYGVQVADRYWLGGAAKGVYENLRDVVGYGGALDLGFMARPVHQLGVGVIARNIGAIIYDNGWDLLPAELAVGANASLGKFNVSADIVVPRESDINVRAGVEYVPVNPLAIRLGYRTGPVDLSTLGFASGLCAGLGVRAGNFELDYSFTPYGKLGLAHRIGLQARYVRTGSSSVLVKVVSAKTNEPIPADLYFTGVNRSTSITDPYGEHLLERLPSGILVVRAARAGYLPQIETVFVRRLDTEQHTTIALQSVEDGGVWGSLVDAGTGKRTGGTVIFDGPSVDTLEIDSLAGSFALRALAPGTYVFTAYGPTTAYIPQTCTLEVKTGRLIQQSFRLAVPPKPMTFPLVYFSIGKAEVMAEFYATIDSAARALKANPTMAIEIAGHADGYELFAPGFASRQALSQARAEAVKELLVSRFGVSPARLTARGYAEFRALAPSDLPEGRAKNRSVEFLVTRQ